MNGGHIGHQREEIPIELQHRNETKKEEQKMASGRSLIVCILIGIAHATSLGGWRHHENLEKEREGCLRFESEIVT